MKWHQWLALGLAALAQAGCSEAAHKQEALVLAKEAVQLQAPPPPPAAPPQEPEAIVISPAADLAAAPIPDPAAVPVPAPAVPAGRLLIYHAEVRLKTTAMPRAAARLDSLVHRSGGFVSAATETRADGEWQQQTTIRVPPSRFQALLSGLSGLGTVEEKKLSTDDVTAEHADVAARLLAKRAVEHQYAALLGKAQKIKDVLDIQEKLGEVREDIEGTESRLKILNDEVGYSTITLTLYQPLPQSVPDAPIVSFGSRLVAALFTGWELLVGLVLATITVWPLLLAGALGTWLWLRHRRQRASHVPEQAPVAA